MANDDDSSARVLLGAAGVHPPEDEIEAMARTYPRLRAAADSLYTPEAADFLPAFFPTDADLREK